MLDDIDRILITQIQIETRVRELAGFLNRDYAGRDVVMICVLRGAIMFYADLLRMLDFKVTTAYMAVSSYGSGTSTSGSIRVQYDLGEDIKGRDVLIVEDIIDSGYTIQYLLESLALKHPKSLRTCCLLDKPSRRKTDYSPDYTGFAIEDRFVVGYGLDYGEKYRNLNAIGLLKEEIYT